MTKVRDFLGPYRLTRLIRVGSTCQVWEALNEGDEKRYALKVLRPDKRDDKAQLNFLKHEFQVASGLSNPRVIRVHDMRNEAGTSFLVLELFSEVNLKQALRRGPEGIAWLLTTIAEQAAEGLYYLHSKGWVHCDVKPDNFLVSRDGEVKLIDFTIAKKKPTSLSRLLHRAAKKPAGTLSYMSPEQIRCQALDERADVYSFGCVLYELVVGKPPFTGFNPSDLLNKHLSASVPSPLVANDNVTQDFADLVKSMMAKNPPIVPHPCGTFSSRFARSRCSRTRRANPTRMSSPTCRRRKLPSSYSVPQVTKTRNLADMDPGPTLDFEKHVFTLERQLHELERRGDHSDETAQQARELRRQIDEELRKLYGDLSAWQTVQVARHKDRPYTRDYLNLAFDEFVELHGDKHFGDDRAMLTGFAKIDRFKVMVIGHQKGRTYRDRAACHFGCAHPEGYRKAMQKMRMAEKYSLPVICFIDTPGAFPGVGAEERGQAQVIAESMFLMSRLRTPVICVVIGEGGSGGALGIGVGDRVAMLQHAYYSVISPEGCAGILWKSHQYAPQAAESLRFTSRDLAKFGVVDDVISEPLGGAHRDHHQMAARMKTYLVRSLRELQNRPVDQLITERYDKFRRMGVFLEDTSAQPA